MTVTPSLMAPPSIPRSQRPVVEEAVAAVVVVVGVMEVVAVVDMVTVVDMVEDDLEATVVVVVGMVVDAVTAVVEVSEHVNI